ncbi:septin 6/8/11 [Nematocida major]|uniref:septin 6/8/11 n=1 Tax=Nematocida major TaxID=1912982 RepID=UPI002008DF18|nr:septin 6/8/11 [Nematocida major]KAH9385807.1 septin 6/8/11 [Nematocida major]
MKYERRQKPLNILLVGGFNTGKTEFIRTLAGTELESSGESPEHELRLNTRSVKITELRGYGRDQNTPEKLAKIDHFVRDSYKGFLMQETKIDRNPFFDDKRVHLLVIFISPAGIGLKESDISLLKIMNKKVNILVVIPKCDYYTAEELLDLKGKIASLLKANEIDTFGADSGEDAVIFSLFSGEKNVKTLGYSGAYEHRDHAVGVSTVKEEAHSEYLAFLEFIEKSHEDLIELTHVHFYERYRSAMLSE